LVSELFAISGFAVVWFQVLGIRLRRHFQLCGGLELCIGFPSLPLLLVFELTVTTFGCAVVGFERRAGRRRRTTDVTLALVMTISGSATFTTSSMRLIT